MCANFPWIPTIIRTTGPLSFVIQLETGTVCRHVDHLHHRTALPKPETITDWTDFPDIGSGPQEEHNTPPELPMVRRSTRISMPPHQQEIPTTKGGGV